MLKERENIKEIILSSKGDSFPLKIKFMDKDDHITDYILFKTRNERLILQKPFLIEQWDIRDKHITKSLH